MAFDRFNPRAFLERQSQGKAPGLAGLATLAGRDLRSERSETPESREGKVEDRSYPAAKPAKAAKVASALVGRTSIAGRQQSTLDADAGELAAVLLRKTVISDVWLVADDGTLADHPHILRSGLPVFLFSEVEQLRGKTRDELKAIGMVKAVFPTGRVLQ
jgi:hypothetical protein